MDHPSSTSITLLVLVALLSQPLLSLSCHPDDKRVLLQIKKSLNKAFDFPSWKPNTDCCQWDGIFCDQNPDQNASRVIQFSITDACPIPCQIPSEVGDLPYLDTLLFRLNPNLTGTIPPAVAKLTRLINLVLDFNSLTGPVPSFLVKLKNLEHLDLSFNKFTGTIPPIFSQFKNIAAIRLDHNKLTGPIPESFGHFAGTIPVLALSENRLTGKVPKSFGQLDFRILDFSHNLLTGDASFLFGSGKKKLESVDLSRNAFGFDLTKVVFPTSLTRLDLSHNKIYGSLPASLAGLKLKHFDVSYNKLCGKIPTGGMLQLFDEKPFLHNRCLCGAPLRAC